MRTSVERCGGWWTRLAVGGGGLKVEGGERKALDKQRIEKPQSHWQGDAGMTPGLLQAARSFGDLSVPSSLRGLLG